MPLHWGLSHFGTALVDLTDCLCFPCPHIAVFGDFVLGRLTCKRAVSVTVLS